MCRWEQRLRAATALLRVALLALAAVCVRVHAYAPGYGAEYDHTDGLTEPGQLSGLQRTVDLQWWDPKLEDWKVRHGMHVSPTLPRARSSGA
jgi:hypothetical protein